MEQDAERDHPEHGVRRGAGEQRVAHHPRRHADDEHPLHSQPPEHQRHGEHEQHLRHLPERLRRGDVLHLCRLQEELRVVVVRGERDADEQRADDEHPERLAAELAHGVQSRHAAERYRMPRRRRRRVRQRERVQPEEDARRAGDVQRPRGGLGLHSLQHRRQHEADEQPRHDPADRPPHADPWELPLLILDVMERQ